MTGEKRMFSSY
jgi:hypothetical protein